MKKKPSYSTRKVTISVMRPVIVTLLVRKKIGEEIGEDPDAPWDIRDVLKFDYYETPSIRIINECLDEDVCVEIDRLADAAPEYDPSRLR